MEDRAIRIDANNIETQHICCAIGDDTANRRRAATKKTWLKSRFIEGLVFERLDARGKVFIEYAPIEAAWKPAVGDGWYVIHCLWVSGRFKGMGFARRLLDGCLAEARAANRAGIAVVTSSTPKPFLTEKSFFTAHGFKVVDTAPPYFELLALELDPKAEPPRFSPAAARNERNGEKGFTFAYSKQCPFMEEYTATLAQIAAKNGYTTRLDHLQSRRDILERGSPFGTLGIYRDGTFVSHELMTAAKFETSYLR